MLNQSPLHQQLSSKTQFPHLLSLYNQQWPKQEEHKSKETLLAASTTTGATASTTTGTTASATTGTTASTTIGTTGRTTHPNKC
jgi:hypothetical protein